MKLISKFLQLDLFALLDNLGKTSYPSLLYPMMSVSALRFRWLQNPDLIEGHGLIRESSRDLVLNKLLAHSTIDFSLARPTRLEASGPTIGLNVLWTQNRQYWPWCKSVFTTNYTINSRYHISHRYPQNWLGAQGPIQTMGQAHYAWLEYPCSPDPHRHNAQS